MASALLAKPDDPAEMTSRTRAVGQVVTQSDDPLAWLAEFQDTRIRPVRGMGFRMRAGGDFFTLDWEHPEAVRGWVGAFPLGVRWFDAEGRQVTKPERPGRYAALIEGTTPGGMHIRRSLTFYARPENWRPELGARPLVTMEPLEGEAIDREVWREHNAVITRELIEDFFRRLTNTEEGAILLAALAEAKPQGQPLRATQTPVARHLEHQLAVKLQVLDRAATLRPLAPPRLLVNPAPVITPGATSSAGVAPELARRLDAVARRWAEESREPFVLLVARRGVIVLHQAYPVAGRAPVTLDSRFDVASISKAITGLMFARFLDQGLLAADDPIGRILPDFPTEGPTAITYRHCFTHTTGLDGHGVWGGMANLWLDNVIANGLPRLSPGRVHHYNGMGYDLAGRAMELVTGRTYLQLFDEDLFKPLGLGPVTLSDLAYSMELSALDLAKLGQLMLNRGKYGDREYFSPQAFEQLLPRPLAELYPALAGNGGTRALAWGLGWLWMPCEENGRMLLGPRVLGHGSASACILRIDLDRDLVVAQVRRTAGPHYDRFYTELARELSTGLID
jgi:CubicO group peptidase (beta-lactamase class C family)